MIWFLYKITHSFFYNLCLYLFHQKRKLYNRCHVTYIFIHSLFRKLLKLTRFSPVELFTTLLVNDTITFTITNINISIFTITNSTIINNIISIVIIINIINFVTTIRICT